jgi:hypothetical protein
MIDPQIEGFIAKIKICQPRFIATSAICQPSAATLT